MSNGKQRRSSLKELIVLGFDRAEDIIYVGLGLLLTAIAFTLLITEVITDAAALHKSWPAVTPKRASLKAQERLDLDRPWVISLRQVFGQHREAGGQ